MTNSQKMDKERDKMMERILNLTLEIIYLMTGEDYIIVKKTSYDYMTPSNHPCTQRFTSRENPILKPSPPSLIPKRSKDAKILEVTQKIIELLTGEVPIRCQDVTVYFSMEEWEYLEGHKDLYKDVMMEKRPPLTSADGSRNTPERCPRPLDSQDYTQEHQKIPQEHQEILQARPLSWDYTQEHQENLVEHHEIPQTHPLYSWDSTQARLEISPDYECENLIDIKVEVKEEEETYVRGDELCKEEEIPPEISSDGQHLNSNWQKHPDIPADDVADDEGIKYGSSEDDDDEIISESFEESSISSSNLHPMFPSADSSHDPSTHRWAFADHSSPNTHHRGGKTFLCSEGGERFNQAEELILHHGKHQGEKPYPCYECGKSFTRRRNLMSHVKSHTGDKQFSCSECGKCFPQRARLFVHQRTHTGVKPYSCSECGKCFIQRVRLRSHERTHTGMKPFFCAECGKCFAERSNLNAHQSCHAGVKPYSCSACGKSFHQRRYLISHERTHTGEKPFSCTECGRCFADRSTLARHQRTHSGEKPFSCSVCAKRFTQKSNLITHEKVHTGEKPYSCSECGKCFSRKSYLISHEKTHRAVKP